MEILKSTLNESIEKGFKLFSNLLNAESYQYHCIELNTQWLVETPSRTEKGNKYPLNEKIKKTFFTEFDKKDPEFNQKVCLYIFEYSNDETDYIIKELALYRAKEERSVSAIKDDPNQKGNILYIGKVKNELGGRLSTHFGFANSKTGGLQLQHWLKKEMILKVHIFAFDKELDDFVNPLELYLSKKLNPLIGKSK